MPRRRNPRKVGQKQWQPGDELIGYIRVSKVGTRGDDLLSPEIQKSSIRQWAEREGVRIKEYVEELDESGRSFAKRQVAALIDRVRRGEAQGIVVWKVSRWGRSLLESSMYIADLQEAGGYIASATENLADIETGMGRFSLNQMLAIAQLQSDQISETWRATHELRLKAGLPHKGGDRFGYRWTRGERDPEKVYVPDSTTGPWLAKAYRDRVAGKPLTAIVREMNAAGIRTVNRKEMTTRSLLHTMDSGFAAGLLVWCDKESADPNTWDFLPGAHTPLIDLDTWLAYLRVRATRRPPREAAPVYRLAGMVRCAECKRKMALTSQHRSGVVTRKMACQMSFNYGSNRRCSSRPAMLLPLIEEVIHDWLEARAKGLEGLEAHQARIAQARAARADAEVIERELAEVDRHLVRVAKLIVEADDPEDADAFKKAQAEYKQRQKELKQRLMAVSVKADVNEIATRPAFEALLRMWERGEVEMVGMMNEALRQVIARIEIGPGQRGGGDPAERVHIVATWDPEADDPMPGQPGFKGD